MYEFTVIKSKRKTMAIEVNSDCNVIVRVPLRCTDKCAKEFAESKHEWIVRAVQKQKERQQGKVIPNKELIIELKKKAEEILPDRVRYFAAIMGVEPTAIKITSAKKRFGSCNSKNSLYFSYMLMLYPQEAIDYVVVHELAHIKHKNHQTDFYNEIKKILPDYKQREKLLR